MNKQDLIFAGVILGVIIMGVLLAPINAVPSIGDIPPTRAFQKIFTNGDNVTATRYNANLNITSGANMLIEAFFSNSTLRFSATAPTLYMEQIANVTSIGCALGQALTVNASAIWACSNIGTGDVTGAANVGTGTGTIFRDEAAGTLNLKTLKEGSGITITNNADDITLSSSAVGGYTEINNLDGGDAKILATNSSGHADLKTLTAGTGITLTNGSKTVTITATGTGGFTSANNLAGGTAKILATNSSSKLNFKSLTQGSNITITNGTDTITIAASVSGGATVLAANVTATTSISVDTLIWTIPLTANSGNQINGFITASSGTTGNAVRGAANVTSLESRGYCSWEQVSTTTANAIDNLVLNTALTGRATNTGETAWIAAANRPMPINFYCSIQSGATPGNLKIWMTPEVASTTIHAKAGSFYIKGP